MTSGQDLIEPRIQLRTDLRLHAQFLTDFTAKALRECLAGLRSPTRQFPFAAFIFQKDDLTPIDHHAFDGYGVGRHGITPADLSHPPKARPAPRSPVCRSCRRICRSRLPPGARAWRPVLPPAPGWRILDARRPA